MTHMRRYFSAFILCCFTGVLGAVALQTPLTLNKVSLDLGERKGPSAVETEDWLLKISLDYDVVDIMKITGHGEGLDEMRLVRLAGGEDVRLISEGEKLRLKKAGFHFMDITDHPDLGKLNAQRRKDLWHDVLPSFPSAVTESDAVRKMMAKLNDKHLRADIAKLTSFWNRYYKSPFGFASGEWLFSQVQDIAKTAQQSSANITVNQFKHSFPQRTVIARIESTERSMDAANKEIVILGAHQDSMNYALPFYRAPGGDDDGSGTVTILQVFRSIVEGGFVPPADVAVEFHWYAAEEGGLLGSQDVAAEYEKEGQKVKGMLQMDMTAFVKNGTEPIIAVFTDWVDEGLMNFTTKLVDAYIPLKWRATNLGGKGSSDHESWHRAGYPVTFVAEGLFKDFPLENVHTAKDDTDQDGQYSFEHMLEFVKLGIAFVAELSIS